MGVDEELGSHRRVALDTMVFIYSLERHAVFGPPARRLLDTVEVGDLVAVASTAVLAEVLVGPYRAQRPDLAQGYLERLLAIPNLEFIAPGVEISRRAAEIRGTTPAVRLIDALHIATALTAGATAFVTNDRDIPNVQSIEIVGLSRLAGT